MKTLRQLCLNLLWVTLMLVTAPLVAQEGAPGESAPATEAAADSAVAPAAEAEGFPPEQIEQLLAPVALYPDALLAQVLMASTYPLDIVQAARWSTDHAELEGEALQQAAAQESWDPSVQALAFFPSVLDNMSKNLDWTQDLGEAYLGQEDEVLAAIQRLREEAHAAGNLESNEQQKVVVEGDTIVVQPAQPEVVYVPTYNPSTVYAQPAPTTNYYPTAYQESSSSSDDGVSFFTGALVGGLLTAAIMWDDDDDWCCGVYHGGPGHWGRPGYWGSPGYWDDGWRRPVNIDRDVNIKTGDITVNRGNTVGKWEHNPEHRGNINYKNERTGNKYSANLNQGVVDRDAARGRAGGGTKPASTRTPAARDVKQPAKRDVQLKRPEPTKAKAPQQKVQKPAASETREVKSRQSTDSRAFKPSSGKEAKAASDRGGKSVQRSGGGARQKSGGGNARARRG